MSFPDSVGAARSTRTEVDWIGRVIRSTDEHATITRTSYDQAGRPSASSRQFLLGAESQLTALGYDDASRLSSLTDFLAGVGRTHRFGYDAAGRLTTLTRANGVVTTHGYDPNRGWLTSITHARAGITLSAWSYTRTPSGDIATETGAGRTRAFSYDGAGRLDLTTVGRHSG